MFLSTPDIPSLALRPAGPADDDLVREIYFQTRCPEFAPLGWPEPMLRNLLASQCAAQRSDWTARFPDSHHDIIVRDGIDIGRLWTDETATSLHLVDIAILPPYQNQGAGSAITRALCARAAERGLELTFSVYKGNEGALRLYHRLGAQITGEISSGTHWTATFPTQSGSSMADSGAAPDEAVG